ncbi:MAG TPA: ABC transporter permease [bacterium]|nr:ABC transporter permease [bacterium]
MAAPSRPDAAPVIGEAALPPAGRPGGSREVITLEARPVASRGGRGHRVLRIGSIVGLLAAWEALARSHAVPAVFLPSPEAVAGELAHLASTGDLWRSLGASLGRIAAGFALGSAAGLIVGVLAGVSRPAEAVADPLIAAIYPIPKIALLPLLILWLGIGEAPKIAVIAVGAFFPVAIGTMSAIRDVDPLLVRAARSLGAGRLHIITKVQLPASVPMVFASLRLAAGMSLLLVVSAEMIAATAGIGYLILYAGDLMQTARLLAGIAVLSVLGLLSTSGLAALERRLFRGRARS